MFALFLFALNTIYMAAAFQIRVQFDEGLVGPKFLPVLASGLTYVALLVILWRESRETVPVPDGASLRRPFATVLITALYVVLFEPLGYVASTFLFALGVFRVFGFCDRRPAHAGLYAAGVTLVFYLLFRIAFHVRLPLLPEVF